MRLYDWQQRVIEMVDAGEPMAVLVIAPSAGEKTYLLDAIESRVTAHRGTFRGHGIEDVRPLFERAEPGEYILLDEGGMMAEPWKLRPLMVEVRAKHVTTIMTTLPDVPSTLMLAPRMTVVEADS